MAVIEAFQLTKVYTNFVSRKQKRAVNNVSFSVGEGQIFGFLGPNGSGKTTTIGMLLDIINRTSGEIRLFGDANISAARKRIGATLETPNFYPYLSGLDNLRIVARIKNIGAQRIQDTLGVVKLADRQKDAFKTYSLGMKQRLALASAMLADPDIIILDEPANGLDPEGIREIREIIKGLGKAGKTVFLSSHLLDEVEQTCTHVAVIHNGALIKQGSVKELTSANVARLEAGDAARLMAAVGEYGGVLSAEERDGAVYATLAGDASLAELNRFLAGRELYLSHLSESRQSLEDVFLSLTQEAKNA